MIGSRSPRASECPPSSRILRASCWSCASASLFRTECALRSLSLVQCDCQADLRAFVLVSCRTASSAFHTRPSYSFSKRSIRSTSPGSVRCGFSCCASARNDFSAGTSSFLSKAWMNLKSLCGSSARSAAAAASLAFARRCVSTYSSQYFLLSFTSVASEYSEHSFAHTARTRKSCVDLYLG